MLTTCLLLLCAAVYKYVKILLSFYLDVCAGIYTILSSFLFSQCSWKSSALPAAVSRKRKVSSSIIKLPDCLVLYAPPSRSDTEVLPYGVDESCDLSIKRRRREPNSLPDGIDGVLGDALSLPLPDIDLAMFAID